MKATYKFAQLLFGAISRYYFGQDIYHAERVPSEGPVILASNHASFYDPFLVGSSLDREVYYLARQSAFFFPLGPVIRAWNAVPVDREGGGPKGMIAIIERLKKGNAIVLFPEGTRTFDGQLQKVKSGLGLIVVKSRAPVVPVRVFGTYEAWNRKMIFPRPRHRMATTFGQPMYFKELRAEADHCTKERLREIYQIISDDIISGIAALKPSQES
ncbi:MAG: lysophospholipid acyltransferase family protein [Verrucomicrobiota bacterium]